MYLQSLCHKQSHLYMFQGLKPDISWGHYSPAHSGIGAPILDARKSRQGAAQAALPLLLSSQQASKSESRSPSLPGSPPELIQVSRRGSEWPSELRLAQAQRKSAHLPGSSTPISPHQVNHELAISVASRIARCSFIQLSFRPMILHSKSSDSQ